MKKSIVFLGALLGVALTFSSLGGCLPQGEGVPFDGCESGSGGACTCSNGLSGVLSCEESVLYCVCEIEEGMDLDLPAPSDMSAMPQEMGQVPVDMGGMPDSGTPPADMMQPADQGQDPPDMMQVPMCGGSPCTCENGPLPAGWVSADVGLVDLAGQAGHLGDEWCLEASGRDIYG